DVPSRISGAASGGPKDYHADPLHLEPVGAQLVEAFYVHFDMTRIAFSQDPSIDTIFFDLVIDNFQFDCLLPGRKDFDVQDRTTGETTNVGIMSSSLARSGNANSYTNGKKRLELQNIGGRLGEVQRRGKNFGARTKMLPFAAQPALRRTRSDLRSVRSDAGGASEQRLVEEDPHMSAKLSATSGFYEGAPDGGGNVNDKRNTKHLFSTSATGYFTGEEQDDNPTSTMTPIADYNFQQRGSASADDRHIDASLGFDATFQRASFDDMEIENLGFEDEMSTNGRRSTRPAEPAQVRNHSVILACRKYRECFLTVQGYKHGCSSADSLFRNVKFQLDDLEMSLDADVLNFMAAWNEVPLGLTAEEELVMLFGD
ncbi:unnamed protein product, partial [Amoebophrya sp. A120]